MIRFCVVIVLLITGKAEGFHGISATCRELAGKAVIGEEVKVITTSGLQECQGQCSRSSNCVGVTYNNIITKCHMFK